jgi:putative ABC transport system substrate-binding protein
VSILASELDVKRLEILRELLPHVRRVGVLVDPDTVSTRRQLEAAARNLEVELIFATARDRNEISSAIDSMIAARVEAVNILASPVFNNHRAVILGHMRRTRLPAIHQWPETARLGGLLAYGPSLVGVYRQLAGLVDRILRGAKPAELSVEQPTKFELIINQPAARELGVTVPQSLLLRADEVVR